MNVANRGAKDNGLEDSRPHMPCGRDTLVGTSRSDPCWLIAHRILTVSHRLAAKGRTRVLMWESTRPFLLIGREVVEHENLPLRPRAWPAPNSAWFGSFGRPLPGSLALLLFFHRVLPYILWSEWQESNNLRRL
jgi:hypothetical protein